MKFSISDCEDHIALKAKEISAHINKSDSSIKYYDNSNNLLCREIGHELEQFKAMKPLPKDTDEIKYIETPDGKKPVIENPQKYLYRSKLLFKFNDGEALYCFSAIH